MRDTELADLAYLLAHDLRSPLQVIGGFADLLARMYGEALDDRGRECIAFIQAGAARMDVLIEDLLGYCRAGKGDPASVAVDLNELVEKLRADLEPEMSAARAALTADDLPTVVSDPERIVEILRILVRNAIRFRAEDVPPAVHIEAETAEGAVTVSVNDNGIGIDEKYHQGVFDVFFRLHSRERYEGTGMGLAVARRLVESIGGTVWVEDRAPGGCRFRFTVPIGGTEGRR